MNTTLQKIKIILSFTFITLHFFIQAQSWQWAKRAGSFGDNVPFTTGEEQITDIKVDKVGNVYATGYFYANPSFNNGEIFGPTTPNGFGLSDAYLIKYSACGKTLWTRRMGGNGYDEANSLVLDNNGNIFVTGYCLGTGNFGDGTHDTLVGTNPGIQFIAKFDTAGKFKEVKNYPYGLGKILLSSQGDFIITNGLTAVKINTLGVATNTYTFVTTTPFYPSISGIAIDKNDNIYLAGSFDNTINIGSGTILLPTASTLIPGTNAPNAIVMKFSPLGNLIWYKRGTNQREDEFGGLGVDTSGQAIVLSGYEQDNYPICNYTMATNNSSGANFLIKLNSSNGTLIWGLNASQDYGSGLYNPIVIDRDNNINIGGVLNGTITYNGSTTYSSNGTYQNCLGRFTPSGSLLFVNSLPSTGSGGNEKINGLAISEQGNIYFSGRFGGTLDSSGTSVNIIGGSEDGFTAKYGFACNSSSTTLTPLAPTSLTATPIGTTVANYVTWVDNANYETSYQLWAIGGSITTYSLIATLAANTTTYNHTGLQVNTNYCYKARAINNIGPSIYTNIGCVTTGTATSINQLTALADFNVYPNPTNGAVTLQFVSTGTKVDLQVMNNLGQLVLVQSLQTTVGDNSQVINLPQAKGLYFVRLSTSTATLVKKVVVD
jgi:hypothetical protein